MKVVILAAGLGSRLDHSEERLPKPLTQLSNGQSILQYQLEVLASFLSLDEIFIVVGYQKEVIMDRFPHLMYIYNPYFAEENTAKSLGRALRKIQEDVLWMNGDVVFHPRVIEKILTFRRTGMVVNQGPVEEEEVKYRADAQGRIIEVSKHVEQAQGEALGINFFTAQDLPNLKKNLELCQPHSYFEQGIERCIVADGQLVWAIPIEVTDCVEIDFSEDLVKANFMLEQWSTPKQKSST